MIGPTRLGRLPRLVGLVEAWLAAEPMLPADPYEAAESLKLALLARGVPVGRAFTVAGQLADALVEAEQGHRNGG